MEKSNNKNIKLIYTLKKGMNTHIKHIGREYAHKKKQLIMLESYE